MARPTPVFPEVGSTIVPPGRSFPSRSAASIIGNPMRSFTEPPGFRYSSLARISAPPGGLSLSSRMMGVAPTSSRMVGYRSDTGGNLACRQRRARLDDLRVAHERDRGHDARRRDPSDDPERERVAVRERSRLRAALVQEMRRARHG